MIFDTIQNCEQYFKLHPQYEKAFAFLKQAMAEFPATGKHEIDGDKLFASVQAYNTLTEDGKMEAHEKYIDIQCMLSGEEIIGVAPISTEKTLTQDKAENDVWFYECKTSNGSSTEYRKFRWLLYGSSH